MVRKIIIYSCCLLTGCQAFDLHFKQAEIETRQGKIKIINSVGVSKEIENINLIGKPFKDPNVPGVVRQEYSLQVDF
jgi:hypothetical protein